MTSQISSGRQSFSGQAAIVGVGYTDFSRDSGRTVLELALQAVTCALADAGLEPGAVDGLLSYHMGDSVPVTTVARTLGLPRLRWHNDIAGGGSQCASILGDAAMAVSAGLAETIVIYRALNGRTGKRMGQIALGSGDDHEAEFLTPFGFRGPVNLMALVAQRYAAERGLTEDDMAALAVQQRAKAAPNPKALMRDPLTAQDYLNSPMIASPLRRLDCCLETDGACALVVTSAERARALTHAPVLIHAVVRGGGPGCTAMDKAGAHPTGIFSRIVAPMIFESAGMAPGDIDLLQLYDGYSHLLLNQLEDFGYCRPDEVGDIIHSGRLGQGGDLPTNLNGGLLSEGYVHGLNNVVEAVEQLQGRAGARQAADVATALCTGFGGSYGSAAILMRG
jgi:acetyl-CoA acetyltransferase